MAWNKSLKWGLTFVAATLAVIVSLFGQSATTTPQKTSSYMPVVDKEDFSTTHDRMSAAKAEIMKRQMDLLAERYDLSNRPAQGVVMDRKKPVQEGVRVKLPAGVTWAQLAGMTPEQIRDRDLFPQGFQPLPHANPVSYTHLTLPTICSV